MPLSDHLPLMKFVGTLAMPVSHVVSFAHKEWIHTYDIQWGLWEWCFINTTGTEDNQPCHRVSVGESPSYYEAVRTMACFALVACVGMFFTFNDASYCGKDKRPIVIAVAAVMFQTITLTVMGTSYSGDERWQDLNPTLGWCFWLECVSAFFGVTMCLILWAFDERKKRGQQPQAVNPAARRGSNASSICVTEQRKITIFLPPSDYNTSWSNANTSGATRQGPRRAARESGSGAAFPVLDLPTYNIPPEPSSNIPTVGPPSYEDVVMGTISPPPPYVPPSGVREEHV